MTRISYLRYHNTYDIIYDVIIWFHFSSWWVWYHMCYDIIPMNLWYHSLMISWIYDIIGWTMISWVWFHTWNYDIIGNLKSYVMVSWNHIPCIWFQWYDFTYLEINHDFIYEIWLTLISALQSVPTFLMPKFMSPSRTWMELNLWSCVSTFWMKRSKKIRAGGGYFEAGNCFEAPKGQARQNPPWAWPCCILLSVTTQRVNHFAIMMELQPLQ